MCDFKITDNSKIRIMPDVHSGSRNLGSQVATFYQNLAIDLNKGIEEYLEKREYIIKTYKEQGRRKEIQDALNKLKWQNENAQTTIPKDLCFLYDKYMENYFHDVKICQEFARRNREKMAEIILEKMELSSLETFHTIHNYIDFDTENQNGDIILRKGAVSAKLGEKLLIPINMRDGSVPGNFR